jgi:hypothetical protein
MRKSGGERRPTKMRMSAATGRHRRRRPPAEGDGSTRWGEAMEWRVDGGDGVRVPRLSHPFRSGATPPLFSPYTTTGIKLVDLKNLYNFIVGHIFK